MDEKDNIYKQIFSRNLRYYMKKNDKSQIDLINDLGINKSAISTWFNGTRLPRMDKVDLLAKYLGVTPADLIEDHNNKPSEPSIISYYNSLNDMGKQEATKRVKELTYIPQYTVNEPLLNAAHEIEGSSDEDKQHDEELLSRLYNNRNKG